MKSSFWAVPTQCLPSKTGGITPDHIKRKYDKLPDDVVTFRLPPGIIGYYGV